MTKRHTFIKARKRIEEDKEWEDLKSQMVSIKELIEGEMKVMVLLSIKAYETYYLSIGFGSNVARQDAEAAVRIELDPDWGQLVDGVVQDIDTAEMDGTEIGVGAAGLDPFDYRAEDEHDPSEDIETV